MKIAKFVLIAIIFLVPLSSAFAATYYVDAVNGNNANVGSQAAPWRTLTKATGSTAANDTVYVKPGTYNAALGEAFPITITNRFFVATTTYQATIEESGAATNAVGLVGNASLEGFTVKGDGDDTAVLAGTAGTDSTLTIKNNIINAAGFIYGLQCVHATDTVSITSNTIYSATQRAIYVNAALASGSITKNAMRDCNNFGIYVNQSNATIDRNTIVRCGTGIYADTAGAGFTVNAKNTIVYNTGVRTTGISQAGAGGTLTSTYNCIFGNATVYNGTVSGKIGDIQVDPTFVDATGNNFNLVRTSECIDVGDPASTVDADGSRADMGAYPYDHRPTVQIVKPNGGETLTGEVSYNITWTATQDSGIDHLQLYYSTDGGATYPNTITTSAPSTGTYGWSVPSINTTTARARIIAVASNSYTATSESAANFSIAFASPTITVPTPTTTTTFAQKAVVTQTPTVPQIAGAAINITVHSSEQQPLTIIWFNENREAVRTTNINAVEGDNTFTWTSPKDIPTGIYRYQIRGTG
ncbi:MAG: DUF1565 domain-containing protein, partial [Candidatus Margulisbacteria bacterium]|nr:DUF1565 domain-containing protein [Candidatus Margulisiibacteriota bacterium]